MSEPATVEARIIDLEVKIAYQDQLISQLSDVIREFALRVEVLERTVTELKGASEPDVGPALDKPPHY